MGRKLRGTGAATGMVAGLALMACVPIFTAGLFQGLNLNFRFDSALPAGEETRVHTAVFPEQVKLKKNFVRISGRLESDSQLPNSVTVKAEVADLESGKVSQRLSLRLNIGADGSFQGSTKIKKNVATSSLRRMKPFSLTRDNKMPRASPKPDCRLSAVKKNRA